MKATMYDSSGAKKNAVELPSLFDATIREDIAQKYFQASKVFQPYGPNPEGGKRHSASGTISHQRHRWGGHYGKGISRVPRKTMWRRGTQFYWVGAEVSGMRGGRRAHPPKMNYSPAKINQKEVVLAMKTGFAATAHKDLIIKRYARVESIDNIPAVIESLPKKTKELCATLKSILGEHYSIAPIQKVVRAGKGTIRGRKYKSNAGVLIVTATDEPSKFKGFDIKPVSQVTIADLFPLGRLTLYTQKALEELKTSC